jgi:hypothetical protein
MKKKSERECISKSKYVTLYIRYCQGVRIDHEQSVTAFTLRNVHTHDRFLAQVIIDAEGGQIRFRARDAVVIVGTAGLSLEKELSEFDICTHHADRFVFAGFQICRLRQGAYAEAVTLPLHGETVGAGIDRRECGEAGDDDRNSAGQIGDIRIMRGRDIEVFIAVFDRNRRRIRKAVFQIHFRGCHSNI